MRLDYRRNLGNTDRIIRLLLGFVLLALPSILDTEPVLTWVLYGIAVFDIAQAVAGY